MGVNQLQPCSITSISFSVCGDRLVTLATYAGGLGGEQARLLIDNFARGVRHRLCFASERATACVCIKFG